MSTDDLIEALAAMGADEEIIEHVADWNHDDAYDAWFTFRPEWKRWIKEQLGLTVWYTSYEDIEDALESILEG